MALYRKYRPSTFAEVVGQKHVTQPLSIALESRDEAGRPDRINHAYLFSGPRGCGKTSSARILARSLNCVEGPTATPCGVCPSCRALAAGGPGNLDVTELDAASHNGVEDMRDLRETAIIQPAESRYRIFIIDEAHMITSQGFNALLKIVEEPPEHLIFIFATTEPEKVLPTIRSRTHHYPFRLLTPNDMRGLLRSVVQHEGVPVSDDVYPMVISAGGGSPRDSLSVMDQLVAGSGPDGVTYDIAAALLGVTEESLLSESVDALVAGDRSAIFAVVDRVIQSGQDPRRFAEDLLQRVRDLLVLSAAPDAVEQGLVDVPSEIVPQVVGQSQSIPVGTLTRFATILNDGLTEFRGASSPRLLLEVMCARMLLPAAEDSVEALLQRVESLERGISVGAGSGSGAGFGTSSVSHNPNGNVEVEQPTPSMDGIPSTDDSGRPLSALQRARLARQREKGEAAAAAPEVTAPAAETAPVVAAADPAPEPVVVDSAPAPEPAQPGVAGSARDAQLKRLQEAREASKRMQELARQQERAERERMAMEREAAMRRADEGDGAQVTDPAHTAPVAHKPEAVHEPEIVHEPEMVPPTPTVTVDDIAAVWDETLALADGDYAMPVRVLAAQAKPLSLDVTNNLLVIGHNTGALANRLNEPGYAATLARAIQQRHNIDVRVQCHVGTRARDHQAAPATPTPTNAADEEPVRPTTPAPVASSVATPPAPATPATPAAAAAPAMPAQQSDDDSSAVKVPKYKQILERRRKEIARENEQQRQQETYAPRNVAPAQAVVDDVPLPPEPVDDAVPEFDDEEEMINAAQNPGQLDHRDMKEVVMELLATELGATPM